MHSQTIPIHTQKSSKIEFTCTACGDCCRNFSETRKVMLFPQDLPTLADGLKITKKELVSKYATKSIVATKNNNTLEVYYIQPLSNGDCPFLQTDNKCGVQSFKPEQCVRTPFDLVWQDDLDYACIKDVNIPSSHDTSAADKQLLHTLALGYKLD